MIVKTNGSFAALIENLSVDNQNVSYPLIICLSNYMTLHVQRMLSTLAARPNRKQKMASIGYFHLSEMIFPFPPHLLCGPCYRQIVHHHVIFTFTHTRESFEVDRVMRGLRGKNIRLPGFAQKHKFLAESQCKMPKYIGIQIRWWPAFWVWIPEISIYSYPILQTLQNV